MKNILFRLVLLVTGFFTVPTAAVFAQTWNFDTSSQGWTLFDAVGSGNYSSMGSGSLTWNATGGNPGGFVSADRSQQRLLHVSGADQRCELLGVQWRPA